MSFRGMCGALAAVALASAAAMAACGDSSAIVTNEQVGGSDSGSMPDVTTAAVDAGPEAASVDAADGATSCGNDPSPPSDDCASSGRCASGDCSAKDSVLYRCFDSGGGYRPPIEGCNRLFPLGISERWCCPPACVPIRQPSFCGPSDRTLACPRLDDGGPSISPPSGCHPSTATNAMQPDYDIVCCN